MIRHEYWKTMGAIFVLCGAMAIAAPAQTFTTLVSFDGTNGGSPTASLVQGPDGSFYGASTGAGAYGGGTVFKVTPEGSLTTLYNFCAQHGCADGAYPEGALALGTDGNFYGTTLHGGNNVCEYQCGTVFRITAEGKLTTLHRFNGNDGSNPVAGLLQAADGNFYGTTVGDTLFKITREGNLTTLYTFCAQSDCADGYQPTGNLVQAADGNFYGTTNGGGLGTNCGFSLLYGCGTVFRITPNGTLKTLHSFCEGDCSDGAFPYAGLLLASDGNFYGTTESTVFKITPAGRLTTIFTFPCQRMCEDGWVPYGELIQGTDGALYGTNSSGGANNHGTVFKITTQGSLTTLHNFDGTDGDFPISGILQATSGVFYGTAFQGGSNSNACGAYGCGTVFSLSTGLGPFVAFVRGYGRVGQTGGILGQGFTGTTNVSLNGTPASYTVVSDTFIRATVPPGATTGFATVTTPSGTLTSNVPFRVIK
jgi:uncharacterized repeat protein (TIGR03803 family)